MKHFLKMADLSCEEIISILNSADELKYKKRNKIPHKYLQDKSLGMIFTKSSTRTRVSFEVGMYELGGSALFLSPTNTQMGRGEPIEDTARVLSRYLDGIVIRTFEHEEAETLAKFSTVPVINGLTDYSHPCQAMADLQTIREYKGSFENKKLCFIGDGNNVANSLIVGGLKVGMDVSVACPEAYMPDDDVVKWALSTGRFHLTTDVKAAAENADVVYTDVWASMGMENEIKKRRVAFEGYCVNDDVMKVAKDDAIVLHCLPAHKEEEITKKVFEQHANEIFDQTENRLHVQKAILVRLMAD